MDWLRKIFYTVIFFMATIAWLTLFESGTINYVESYKSELQGVLDIMNIKSDILKPAKKH